MSMHNSNLNHESAPVWALASLSIPLLMASLDTSITNVALPTLSRAFGAPFHAVQWVVLAYLVALTSLIVGVGRLGDLFGRRRLLLAGIALFTLASAACGLASSHATLVVARAVQGVGASTMMALALSFAGGVAPQQSTGRTMGVLGSMSAIGTALGPTLGGALIALAGWRSVFLVNVPIGIASLVLVRLFLPADRPHATRVAFDHAGTWLLALTLGAWSLAMTLDPAHVGARTLALLVLAALALFAFVQVERRVAAPLLQLRMLRERALGTSLVLSALVSAVVMTTLVVGPFYLSHALALGTARVGLVLSVGPVVVALTGLPAGRAVDRFGARVVMRAGLAGMAAGALLLALLPAALGVAGYVPPIVLLTASYALFQTADNTAVMLGVTRGDRGVVSGLLSLSRNLGLVTGASAMGTVFAAAAGALDIAAAAPAAVALGMHATFGVAAVLMLVALALAARTAAPAQATRTTNAAHKLPPSQTIHSNPGGLS